MLSSTATTTASSSSYRDGFTLITFELKFISFCILQRQRHSSYWFRAPMMISVLCCSLTRIKCKARAVQEHLYAASTSTQPAESLVLEIVLLRCSAMKIKLTGSEIYGNHNLRSYISISGCRSSRNLLKHRFIKCGSYEID